MFIVIAFYVCSVLIVVVRMAVKDRRRRTLAQLRDNIQTLENKVARYEKLLAVLEPGRAPDQSAENAERSIDSFVDLALSLQSATANGTDAAKAAAQLRQRLEQLPAAVQFQTRKRDSMTKPAQILEFKRSK
jgi:hypothetical protein